MALLFHPFGWRCDLPPPQHSATEKAAQEGPPLILPLFHITSRVAEPAGLARRLPPLANDVTDQGLGEESTANGAGNPVLTDVASLPYQITNPPTQGKPQALPPSG